MTSRTAVRQSFANVIPAAQLTELYDLARSPAGRTGRSEHPPVGRSG
jgi:hypothetical protein